MRAAARAALVALPAGAAVGIGLWWLLRLRQREAPSEPPTSVCSGPAPSPMPPAPRPRVPGSEVTADMRAQAVAILREHHTDPVGTLIPFQSAGSSYLARIEWHCHPPGGAAKPWGWHKGVSLLG